MAVDFRRIERLIEEFFRTHGVHACRAGGDLYVGAASSLVEQRQQDGGERYAIVIDDDEPPRIVSLTELAQELAESLG